MDRITDTVCHNISAHRVLFMPPSRAHSLLSELDTGPIPAPFSPRMIIPGQIQGPVTRSRSASPFVQSHHGACAAFSGRQEKKSSTLISNTRHRPSYQGRYHVDKSGHFSGVIPAKTLRNVYIFQFAPNSLSSMAVLEMRLLSERWCGINLYCLRTSFHLHQS